MRVLRFAAEVGRSIQAFGSVEFRLTPLARLTSGARIACARLGAGGRIGRHPAASAQLLLVVEGEGCVRGETGDEVPIQAGQAAFWAKGEQHETSTTGGLTAIIIEAESLDPDVFSLAGSLTADSQR